MSKHLYCLTAKATVDAEATVFKVSGSYDSPTMDLFFWQAKVKL